MGDCLRTMPTLPVRARDEGKQTTGAPRRKKASPAGLRAAPSTEAGARAPAASFPLPGRSGWGNAITRLCTRDSGSSSVQLETEAVPAQHSGQNKQVRREAVFLFLGYSCLHDGGYTSLHSASQIKGLCVHGSHSIAKKSKHICDVACWKTRFQDCDSVWNVKE